jgi:hypothetical protein
MTLGALSELKRILISDAADIVNNRSTLLVMASVFTGLLLFGAIYCWWKALKK